MHMYFSKKGTQEMEPFRYYVVEQLNFLSKTENLSNLANSTAMMLASAASGDPCSCLARYLHRRLSLKGPQGREPLGRPQEKR